VRYAIDPPIASPAINLVKYSVDFSGLTVTRIRNKVVIGVGIKDESPIASMNNIQDAYL
jgi:hypothetical protein